MQAHFIVTGFVQGVGYRKFVKHEARKLGLTGWTKNNLDGSVEAVVQGEKEKIEKLITICEKGPFLSRVDNIHVDWEDAGKDEEYEEFVVRHE